MRLINAEEYPCSNCNVKYCRHNECARYSRWLYSKVDAVPVVRCKDCRHNYGRTHNLCCGDIVCDYHMSDGFEENDFCSYGALMDGDEHDSC